VPRTTRLLHRVAPRSRANLTARQAGAVILVVLVGIAVGVSTALDQQPVATALLGLLLVLVFLAVVQVRRRLAQETRAVTQELLATRRELARLSDRLRITQRRVVTAVESERLVESDRHIEVMASVGRIEERLRQP
jgi:cobalamin biosynthesis protein CobD/CbiB